MSNLMASISKTSILIFVYGSLLLSARHVLAEDATISETSMKAAYSFSFGKFASWPTAKLNNNKMSLGFCILGKNPFGRSMLEAAEGKRVKGKSLHIELFENGLLAEDALADCHILFISQSETVRYRQILNTLRFQPILTVSDIDGFSNHGGMITLIKVGEQIQFEINPDAISLAGLTISSKLFELATVIRTDDKTN